MKHITSTRSFTNLAAFLLAGLAFGAAAGCVAEDGDGAPTEGFGAPSSDLPALGETSQALADETWGCHMETMYIDNNMNPTTQPWAYCICGVNSSTPPAGSWDMGGGYWTMPWPNCGYQYPQQ